ncbi:reverse transcriptase [Phytophthora megakarya]|uniref:Reverse transcriptase n=1 Tax=Phytophthora megakarya TaxID=4795 RepID=A0A225WWB2_9STRA|nr:reverse transcriptase [Phytophthora megakarya]
MEWVLSGEDDGSDPPDLGLYYPIWTFRVESDAFWAEECAADLPADDRQRPVWVHSDPEKAGDLERLDVFEAGEPEDPSKPSVLGRRSYIDDILVPADNWDELCDRVEDLLEVISGGMPKVEYLGHKVLHDGLEANPKDLSALMDLEFPGSLRAMQLCRSWSLLTQNLGRDGAGIVHS